MKASDLPTMTVESLIPYVSNSRTHSEAQVAQIAASIREFGFTNPILVDEKGGIIAGHGRLLAARKLGMDGVPVLVLAHLTDAQKRAYVIADNKLALNAGWDEATLRAEIEGLRDEGYDLNLTGFDAGELEALLADKTKGETDPDDAPPAPEDPTTRLGDVWILGKHRLVCGDATSPEAIAALMGQDLADMVWTDPPYNVAISGKAGKIMNDDMSAAAFRAFLDGTYRSYLSAMRPGAVIYVAHADFERVAFTAAFADAGIKLSQVRVWVKQSATLSRQDFNWQHEPILYGWKEGAGHYFAGDFTLTTVIEDKVDVTKLNKAELLAIVQEMIETTKSTVIHHDRPTKSDLHPTMKPVALIVEMVEASSREGEIVLDLFGGSGSTLIACETTGRRCRIMELDPKFADVIVTRWQSFTGRPATLEATGQAYGAVVHERAHREAA